MSTIKPNLQIASQVDILMLSYINQCTAYNIACWMNSFMSERPMTFINNMVVIDASLKIKAFKHTSYASRYAIHAHHCTLLSFTFEHTNSLHNCFCNYTTRKLFTLNTSIGTHQEHYTHTRKFVQAMVSLLHTS